MPVLRRPARYQSAGLATEKSIRELREIVANLPRSSSREDRARAAEDAQEARAATWLGGRYIPIVSSGGNMAHRLLTTTQVAAILGVKPNTVTHYIERGLIQAEKVGRDWLIEPNELERFRAARRQAGRPKESRELE